MISTREMLILNFSPALVDADSNAEDSKIV